MKTAIIWAVFRRVGRRLIAGPLEEMIGSIAGAATPRPITLSPPADRAIAGTDLAALRDAYNALAHRAAGAQAELELANDVLERRVADRTVALAEANRRLEDLANTDFLTGLANRRQFIAHAEALIARSRDDGGSLALVICDLDRFKEINDEFGHAAGDRALCHVAERIVGTIRQHDFPARIGGDEFVVLLPDATLQDATAIAERLRAQLSTSALRLSDGREMRITASIGIAALATEDENLDDLFQRADLRLYAAKGSGRDCVANTH
jgi:diguanylate cyclase (GGDEF)-like protein